MQPAEAREAVHSRREPFWVASVNMFSLQGFCNFCWLPLGLKQERRGLTQKSFFKGCAVD